MGIALQLYTVREAAAKDIDGALRRAKEAGFDFVQWSGMPKLGAGEIRCALEKAGLEAIAAHCDVEPFETGFDDAVAFWKETGATDVAPGGMMGDCRDDLAGWLQGAKRLDALGTRLRAAGMRLSYHNHAMEFEKFAGDERCKLDVLYEETGATNLYAELDTAWVQVGGGDPAACIRKYAGRCPVIHVKDLAAAPRDGRPWFTPLGEGVLDWPAIFVAARDAGVEWYVYEQDTWDGDVFDSVRTSCEFLKANA